jgi:hypothetical protein
MRWLARYFRFLTRSQTGVNLIENIVAVGILALIGVVFMSAMDVAHQNVGEMDRRLRAETLIRTQIEDIKNADYETSGYYPVTVNLPPQYTMNIDVRPPQCIGRIDNCIPLEELMGYSIDTIQEITVTVYHGGDFVLKVACYKTQS